MEKNFWRMPPACSYRRKRYWIFLGKSAERPRRIEDRRPRPWGDYVMALPPPCQGTRSLFVFNHIRMILLCDISAPRALPRSGAPRCLPDGRRDCLCISLEEGNHPISMHLRDACARIILKHTGSREFCPLEARCPCNMLIINNIHTIAPRLHPAGSLGRSSPRCGSGGVNVETPRHRVADVSGAISRELRPDDDMSNTWITRSVS